MALEPARAAELERAVAMRGAGRSYRQIAEIEGVSLSTAHSRVQRALLVTIREPAEVVRELELARLDALAVVAMAALAEFVPMRSRGNRVLHPVTRVEVRDWAHNLAAVDVLVRISERRAKLLGLDVAPVVPPAVVAGEVVSGEGADAGSAGEGERWLGARRTAGTWVYGAVDPLVVA